MVGEERDQNNDRNRHAEQIKYGRTHRLVSLFEVLLSNSGTVAQALGCLEMVPLPAPDRRGVARAKCADQQRQEGPQQQACSCLASCIGRFAGLSNHLRYSLRRIALGEAGAGADKLRQIVSVGRCDVSLLQRMSATTLFANEPTILLANEMGVQ